MSSLDSSSITLCMVFPKIDQATQNKLLVRAVTFLLAFASGVAGWWIKVVQNHINESHSSITRLQAVEKQLQNSREEQIIYQMWTARRIGDTEYLEFLSNRLNQLQSERNK